MIKKAIAKLKIKRASDQGGEQNSSRKKEKKQSQV